MNNQQVTQPEETETRLLKALASLNQISNTINHIGSGDVISSADSLQLIVESAILVVPGSSAVIYTFDELHGKFELMSRVSAEPEGIEVPPSPNVDDDHPRPNGIGIRTILRRRSVLSYQEPDLEVHPYHSSLGVKAVGCFPLIVVDQVVGVLYVYLHEERHFTQLELLMLDNFVNQAAMAIYHARRLADVHRDLRRKEEELSRLHRAGMLISSRLSTSGRCFPFLGSSMFCVGSYAVFFSPIRNL